MSAKDDNGFPVIYGVSHLDGKTPVKVEFQDNHLIKIDLYTSILFDPDIEAFQTDNDFPLAKAEDDDGNVRPWVVNAYTGAVLVDKL